MKSIRRGLQRIERVLWATAALGVMSYVGTWAVAAGYQFYANWSFNRSIRPEPALAKLFTREAPAGEPEVSAPSPPEATAWTARLEIPRLNYSVMVREGTGRTTLRLGVGHIEGTALPGPDGNVGLAGHRDTFFRRLGELRVGDGLLLRTRAGTYDYTVSWIKIVKPSENSVLSRTASASLTLVTCYPLWGIGPAPQRYIVHANLNRASRSAKEPYELLKPAVAVPDYRFTR